MLVAGQRGDLVAQPRHAEPIGEIEVDRRDDVDRPAGVAGDLGDVERGVQGAEGDDALRELARHAARHIACRRRIDARALVGIQQLRQPCRKLLDVRREVLDRRAHVVDQPARAQEPLGAAFELAAGVDQHLRLHLVGHLVVELLDAEPQGDHAEDLAAQQVGTHDLERPRAGGLDQPVHEGAADPVDHAVGDMRRDDFALERMARHVGAELVLQQLREVAFERRCHPRVVGQRRPEQLVVEPDLAVGEQHRALRARQAEALAAPVGDLFVGRQEFELALEPPALLEVVHEAQLGVEQRRRDAPGDRQHLGLEDVVAQHERGHVVGHLRQQRVALLVSQLAFADGQAEQDLDVDLVVRGVDARRVVDRIGVDAPAGERVFDPPELGATEVAAFGEDLAAQLAAVDAQCIVGAVAHLRMGLAGRLDVGADAAVVDQVHRRLEDRVDELGGRHRIGRDAERALDLGRDRDRLQAARMDAAAGRDQLGVVVGP